jgi:hypothetical protein
LLDVPPDLSTLPSRRLTKEGSMATGSALRRGYIVSAGVIACGLAGAASPAAAQTSPICSIAGGVPVVGTVTNCPPSTGVTAPGVTVPGVTVPGVNPGTSTLPIVGGSTGTGNGTGNGTGAGAQRDARAPRLRVSARRGRLSLALRKGYSVVVFCDESCSVSGQVAQSGRRATVGRGSARVSAPGKVKLKLRFTSAARQALRRKPSAKLTIRVTVTDAAGNAATKRAAVTLKR